MKRDLVEVETLNMSDFRSRVVQKLVGQLVVVVVVVVVVWLVW